jgi:hypothetical protein
MSNQEFYGDMAEVIDQPESGGICNPKNPAPTSDSYGISAEQAGAELEILLDKYEWFFTTVVEKDRITVYCNRIDAEVYAVVPTKLYGHDIFTAFTAHLNCAEQYGKKGNGKPIRYLQPDTSE